MKKSVLSSVGTVLLIAVWLTLSITAWCKPSQDISSAERRDLAQFPSISPDTLLSTSFMTDFENYTLDQFPLRDGFRTLKSVFHSYILGQKDNNGIYIADGYAAQLSYPLSETSVNKAIGKFNQIYEKYLADSGSQIYLSIVPDKGFYLAEQNGYPAMDYDKLFSTMEDGTPWAVCVDLTDCLSIQDYYRTDTHWRQEQLLPAAQKLCQAMNVTAPQHDDFTQTEIQRPFYGVYYGQSSLPMEPEIMYVMESNLLSACTVTHFETGRCSQVYDRSKLDSPDLYDVYLSGATALLTIDNPLAKTNRELIVFRDSFGSSLVPLLIQDYRTVSVLDIRYLSSALLEQYLTFQGQDVLFLYSTLILNSSSSLK